MRHYLALVSVAFVAFFSPTSTAVPVAAPEVGFPLPLGVAGPLSDLQDPGVCEGPDNVLYLFASGEGIPVRTSCDGGGTWEDAGLVFPDGLPADAAAFLQASPSNSGALQGPDCTYVNETGQFVLVYAATTGEGRRSAIFAATSTSPSNPSSWIDHGLVLSSDSNTDYNALSPHLIDDPSYPLYLALGEDYSTLRMIALDRTTLKPESSELIDLAERPDNGSIGSPFVFRTESPFTWWLLSTSGDPSVSSTDPSTIRMARTTRSVTDPYRAKDGGLLRDGAEGTVLLASHEGVRNPASPSVWWDEREGRWKLAYQYTDDSGRSQVGLNYLDFDTEDGWPVLA